MTPQNQHAHFDGAFWHDHWQERPQQRHQLRPNPYVSEETAGLKPGTALDAGCGTGAEALWLAEHGWQVTAVDISDTALDIARQLPHAQAAAIQWLCADLTRWQPERRWDLVITNYAHTPMPQLKFYARIADWVAPGGELLIVAHKSHDDGEHQHPSEATVTPEAIAQVFDGPQWKIETAKSQTRQMNPPKGPMLHDVIVRVHRKY